MKTLRGLLAIVAVLFVCCAFFHAQQQPSESVEALKEQIRNLERIESDPNTPPDVRELNQSFLAKRRSQLREISKKRIDALRAYLASVKGALTVEESQKVERAINDLEKNLVDPKNSASGATLATADRVSGPTAETPNSNLPSSAANLTRASSAVVEDTAPAPAPTPQG